MLYKYGKCAHNVWGVFIWLSSVYKIVVNTVKQNFVLFFGLVGTAASYTDKISPLL